MDPLWALRQIALHLERRGDPTYKVQAFRKAAAILERLTAEEIRRRVDLGTISDLPGIGKTTATVVTETVRGGDSAYLMDLIEKGAPQIPPAGPLLAALRGDCHTHSDWSDGGSPIPEMAEAARELGHEWMVLTDHSPRLTIANGLTADRLRRQLDVIAELNTTMTPFLILTGIEVDILDAGGLDQDEELLARLDVVVASVHSKLRMPKREMTHRMLTAVANPHVDVLGHCTGRLVVGKGRPESTFDSAEVFAACREYGVAVEINSRPERLDPPKRLLREAVAAGCSFAIDTDAHAPGQLSWLPYGVARAEECEVPIDRVVNTRGVDDLLAWTRRA